MNLTELRDDFTQLLDDLLEVVVVDDVRNVTPPCVLVGLPTVDWSTHAVTQMVHVIAPGGNADDVDWMLNTLTEITVGPLGNRYRPTTAGPGSYGVSADRLYPAYEISYRIPQPATFCLAVSPPVPPPPRVTLTVDDVTDLTVTVTVGNTDPDAPPASVDWGDGSETPDFTHTYDEPGTYRVVGRQYGRRDSIPQSVTVTAAPVPQLTLTVDTVDDLEVTVSVGGTDPLGDPATVDWDDGTINATRTHTYAAAGTYTLIAEQVGRTDSDPVDVTVTAPPPATGATAGTPGTFTPAGSTPPANFAGITALTASPPTRWTTGQYVAATNADEGFWNGTAWVTGRAPAPSPLEPYSIGWYQRNASTGNIGPPLLTTIPASSLTSQAYLCVGLFQVTPPGDHLYPPIAGVTATAAGTAAAGAKSWRVSLAGSVTFSQQGDAFVDTAGVVTWAFPGAQYQVTGTQTFTLELYSAAGQTGTKLRTLTATITIT